MLKKLLKQRCNFLCFITDKKEGEGEESGDGKTEDGKKDDKTKKTDKADKKKEDKKAKKEPKTPKIETFKEPLEFEVTLSDLANMTAEQKTASKENLISIFITPFSVQQL